MTFDQIVDQALARAMDFGNSFPTARPVLYRRIEVRQQHIFTLAGRVNPDYFGVTTTGTLDVNGEVDLGALDVIGSAIDPSTAITRVEISDPGTHPTLQAGDEVTLVTVNDLEAGLAPRMTLRNATLRAILGDMAGVTSVLVYYSYRPALKDVPMDGSEQSELPSVYDELLVIDLTKWLLMQSMSMSADAKLKALEALTAEEANMMSTFLAEVGDFAGAQVSRFNSVVGGQRK